MRRIAAILCLLAGCNNTGIQREQPNQPPETQITSGPPELSTANSYRVDMSWFGSDPDGTIDHYDLIVVDHPAAWESPGDVAITIPEPDDPRWASTTSSESTFVLSADALHIDPQSLPPDQVLEHFFERWHTVFVRAVDDKGAPDPHPDYRSFNARTLAPTVALQPPVWPRQMFVTPPNVVFRWSGQDPLDKAMVETPIESRWALIATRRDTHGDFIGFPDSLYRLGEERWSPWRGWDDPDGSGTSAILRDLQQADGQGHGFYIFAVQAKDEAGAVTPVFDASTWGKNNAVTVFVTGIGAPLLSIQEEGLGGVTCVGTSHLSLLAAAGQPIAFHWRGDAWAYGGRMDAYRYGWNLVDPGDDASWDQPWSATALAATPRSFETGPQIFYLEARDDLGSVTHVELEIAIESFIPHHDLLLVDDTRPLQAMDEDIEDARWLRVFQELQGYSGLDFDSNTDVFDVANRMSAPPIATLFDYRTIVWSVTGAYGSTALGELAGLFNPNVERNYNSAKTNVVNLYIENGGKLWVCGDRPAHAVWPVETFPTTSLPVDVLHWLDPLSPQGAPPGAGCFLDRMGVARFDLGEGPSAPAQRRDRPEHACVGLRPVPAADAPPDLVPGPTWPSWTPDVNPLPARRNIEIYDMTGPVPGSPPATPDPRVQVVYTYVSGVPADPSQGLVYPLTADGQPAFLLVKRAATDASPSRALCGFEPWRLTLASHVALAKYVLLDHFGVGRP